MENVLEDRKLPAEGKKTKSYKYEEKKGDKHPHPFQTSVIHLLTI